MRPADVRVAMDVTPAITGSTGVARYTADLRGALGALGVEVAAFAIGRGQRQAPAATRHIHAPLRVVQRAWQFTGRPLAENLVGPVDVVHSIDLVAPPTRRPLVVTVHDLVALELPDLHDDRARRQQEARLIDVARADVVIVPTAATAGSLARWGADVERVVVVPHGLPALGAPVPVSVPDGAVLAVGTLSRRKGLDVLLRAAAAMRRPAPVVLAGPIGDHAAALRHLIDELGIGERVMVLGAVDDRTLAGLYRAALALCFPSRAEGFGLPLLEAMAAGLPVVATDLEVIREVTDGAAVLTPPEDHLALAAVLDKVVADGALRSRLSAAGRLRAASFTWEAAASRTLGAYQRAAESARLAP